MACALQNDCKIETKVIYKCDDFDTPSLTSYSMCQFKRFFVLKKLEASERN